MHAGRWDAVTGNLEEIQGHFLPEFINEVYVMRCVKYFTLEGRAPRAPRRVSHLPNLGVWAIGAGIMRAPSRIIMSGYCLGEDDYGLQNAEAGFGVVNTQHARSLRGLWAVSSYGKRIQLFSQN